MSVFEDECMVATNEELKSLELDSVSRAAAEGVEETNTGTINTNPDELAEMKPSPASQCAFCG